MDRPVTLPRTGNGHAPTHRPRALRVLQVTPRYFPMLGGVESHVHEVSHGLARAGAQVTILTTDPSGMLPPLERTGGVTVCRVKAWPANRDYYWAPGLIKRIRSTRWDIVHLQSYHTLVAPVAMAAALTAHLPYVVTFHGGGHSSRLRNAIRAPQRALLRPLLARATRLVAVAASEVELYSAELKLPNDRFVVIPNGADLPAISAHAAIAPRRAGPLIVSVGRLERYKGHHRLIEALPEILQQVPDAAVWIAGVGPYENELRQLANRLGVADRVEIRAIPASQRQQMADELSQAALVVLLSEFETHPISALEALALGRPLLVTANPGLRELADRGWARSVSPASGPQEVAAAVVLQLRRPLIPTDVKLPSWDDCAQGLLSLYRSILPDTLCES